MLTVKEINEVSFGKAGFSGYKPEDVDNFIDEVVESFTQLQTERDSAVQQTAQLAQQMEELKGQIGELKAKNVELQKKLAILAQKIEAYREEEDGIKDAILSAQKMARESIQEAKGKAAVMLADAEDSAKKIMENARDDAARAAREYAVQVDQKKGELEEMKRQVSAFRVSLLEMYKKHLESINHIPSFRLKETTPAVESRVQPESAAAAEPEPEPEPAPRAVKEKPAPQPQPEPQPEPETEPVYQEEPEEVVLEPQPQPKAAEPRKQPAKPVSQPVENPPVESATLHDKVDLSREQLRWEPDHSFPEDDDLTQVGIDLKAYSDIPESLQREKASHFSNLEFGDNVDFGKKRRKK